MFAQVLRLYEDYLLLEFGWFAGDPFRHLGFDGVGYLSVVDAHKARAAAEGREFVISEWEPYGRGFEGAIGECGWYQAGWFREDWDGWPTFNPISWPDVVARTTGETPTRSNPFGEDENIIAVQVDAGALDRESCPYLAPRFFVATPHRLEGIVSGGQGSQGGPLYISNDWFHYAQERETFHGRWGSTLEMLVELYTPDAVKLYKPVRAALIAAGEYALRSQALSEVHGARNFVLACWDIHHTFIVGVDATNSPHEQVLNDLQARGRRLRLDSIPRVTEVWVQSITPKRATTIVCVPAHQRWEVPSGPGTSWTQGEVARYTGDRREWFAGHIPEHLEASIIVTDSLSGARLLAQERFDGECAPDSQAWQQAVNWLTTQQQADYVNDSNWTPVQEWIPTEADSSLLPLFAFRANNQEGNRALTCAAHGVLDNEVEGNWCYNFTALVANREFFASDDDDS